MDEIVLSFIIYCSAILQTISRLFEIITALKFKQLIIFYSVSAAVLTLCVVFKFVAIIVLVLLIAFILYNAKIRYDQIQYG